MSDPHSPPHITSWSMWTSDVFVGIPLLLVELAAMLIVVPLLLVGVFVARTFLWLKRQIAG